MGGSAAGVASRAPLATLRHRDLRLFLAGQFSGASGFWIATVALGWLVLQITNSATWVGLVGFLSTAPTLLFTPLGGAVADRVQRRPLIAGAAFLLALLIAVLALLTGLSLVSVEHVAVAVAFMGLVYAFDQPARNASVPNLVPREEMVGGIALYSAAYNASRFVGPALAGVAAASVGLAWTLALASLAYGGMLAATLALRQPLSTSRAASRSVFGTLVEGLAYVHRDPRLTVLLVLVAVTNVAGWPYLQLMPLFADREFAVGVTGLGVLLAAPGVGALGGAVAMAVSGRLSRPSKTVYIALFGMLATLLIFAATPSLIPAVALLFLAGWMGQIFSTTAQTLLQSIAPDQMRGRVMSLFTMTWGLGPIGALPLGALADVVGVRWAISVGLVANLGVALAVLRLRPRLDE